MAGAHEPVRHMTITCARLVLWVGPERSEARRFGVGAHLRRVALADRELGISL
jgi:hypothetical protein